MDILILFTLKFGFLLLVALTVTWLASMLVIAILETWGEQQTLKHLKQGIQEDLAKLSHDADSSRRHVLRVERQIEGIQRQITQIHGRFKQYRDDLDQMTALLTRDLPDVPVLEETHAA